MICFFKQRPALSAVASTIAAVVTMGIGGCGGSDTGPGASPITPTPTPDTAPNPTTAPVGNITGRIAFVSNRDGNNEIYSMNASGGTATRLTSNGADDREPSFGLGGQKIVFVSSRDGNNEIYSMNADGSGVTRLTNNPANDRSPELSRDGSKIAFSSNRDGNFEIYVMNVNGSGLNRVTNHPASDTQPTFSPLVNKLIFVRESSTPGAPGSAGGGINFARLHRVNVDGSGVTSLTIGLTERNPAWSPNGRTIAYDAVQPQGIYAINPDGSGERRITTTPLENRDPTFSPDSRRIALVSTRDGNEEIYLMNADGSGQTRLTNSARRDFEPSWSR